jgi:hypothetical protein
MMQRTANLIPHEYRQKILMEWLPDAKPSMTSEAFQNLWEAYFIYIDSDAVRKNNCPICWKNVLDNWKALSPYILEAERNYALIEKM